MAQYEFDEQGYPILGATPAPEQYKFDDAGYPILDAATPAQVQPQATPATDPTDYLRVRSAYQDAIDRGSSADAGSSDRASAEYAAKSLAKLDAQIGGRGTPFLPGEEIRPADLIDQTPHEKLMASDRYRQVFGSALPVLGEDAAKAYAKDTIGKDAHHEPFLRDSIFADLLGMPKSTAFDLHYRDENKPADSSANTSQDVPDPFVEGQPSNVPAIDQGNAGAIIGYNLLEGAEQAAKIPALSAAGLLSIFGGDGTAAQDFLFKWGVDPQESVIELAKKNKPIPIGFGEQVVDKVSAMIPGLALAAATKNPEFLETAAPELFSMAPWQQAWRMASEKLLQQMPAAEVMSTVPAVEAGQRAVEQGGGKGEAALAALGSLEKGTAQMSMPMAGGGTWYAKALTGGGVFTAQDIAESVAAGQPVTAAGVAASAIIGAAMGQMHQEQQKFLVPKFANAMAAMEHDPVNMERVQWVADSMLNADKPPLWAAAELHNITVHGVTRDEAGFQQWQSTRIDFDKAKAEADQVVQPTEAETATPEAQATLSAAEDLVGTPGEDVTQPAPEGAVGDFQARLLAAQQRAAAPPPVEEEPTPQAPRRAGQVSMEQAAEGAKQFDIDRAHAEREAADQQTRDEQLAQAEPDRQQARLDDELARAKDDQERARAMGEEEAPPPNAMQVAIEKARADKAAKEAAKEKTPEQLAAEQRQREEDTAYAQRQADEERAREPALQDLDLQNELERARVANAGKGAEEPTAMQLAFRKARGEPEPTAEELDFRHGDVPTPRETPLDNGIPKDTPSARNEGTDLLERAYNTREGTSNIRFEALDRKAMPREISDALDAVERFTGAKVHIVRDTTPGGGNVQFTGAQLRNHIYIHEGADHPLVHVLSHEWTHYLKKTVPPLYQILENEVKRQGRVDAYTSEAVRRGYRADKALEELTADTTGDSMGDRSFMEKMAKDNPAAFGKLADSFGKYLDKFTTKHADLGSNRFVNEVGQYRATLAAVMHTYSGVRDIQADRKALTKAMRAPVTAPVDERKTSDDEPTTTSARTSSPEDQGGFGRGGEVEDNARYQGGARAGQYIGAPAKYNTPAKIPALRRLFRQLTLEGESGRHWYRDSGRWILQHAGSVEEARKLAKVLSIYSPQAKVDANTTMALHAWEQYKAGQPINAKTGVQDAYASRVLYGDGVFEGGEKTNNFYNNLMRHIDPEAHARQGATIDLWMMRAAGYHTDSPTNAAYRFVENEVNRTARELGWSPEEVQAAIWVAMKARTENKGVKERTEAESTKKGYMRYDTNAKGEEVRNVLNEEGHRNTWLKHAMKLEVSPEDTRTAAYHFGTALNDRAAQLSHESIPSVESGVLPGIHDAPMEQKIAYHRAIQEALKDPDGRDAIDKVVGPFAGPGVEGFSGWEGKSTVGTQQAQPIYTKDGRVSDHSRQLIELNQAIRGQILNQKGMAWHYPIYDGSKYVQNGAEVNLGRHLTEPENEALYQALAKHLGHSFAPPIPTVNGEGFRVLNFPEIEKGLSKGQLVSATRKANDDFHLAVQMAIREQPWHNEVADYARFQSDGNLISSEVENGPASYRGRIESSARAIEEARPRSWGGRSDIQDWIEQDLRPRVEAVNSDFAKRYGWDKPGGEELNLHLPAAEENVAPHSDKNGDGEPVKTIRSPVGKLQIETPKGATRTGKGEDGKPFSRVMKHDYGYIEGVPGRDGGSMDVLVGEGATNPMRPVFVVHQKNGEGGFDEHKVLVGFQNRGDAVRAYLSEYPRGWDRMGDVEQFTTGGFKTWAKTEGREQAQVGKVDPSVPRFQVRPQQPDAVAMHAMTSTPMPVRTGHTGAALPRLDLPNAPRSSQARTHFDDASRVTGTHQVVLRNLYDVNTDPRNLFDAAVASAKAKNLPLDEPHVMNELENHIVANGFDGYRSADGKAIVLGGKVRMEKANESKPVDAGRPVVQPAAERVRTEAPAQAPRGDVAGTPAGPREDQAGTGKGEGDHPAPRGAEEGEGGGVPDRSSRADENPDVEDTSIRNAATDAVRKLRGAAPVERIGGRTANEVEAQALGTLFKNPNRGRELAKEVAEHPRNISDTEAAILAIDRQRIAREHDEATARVARAMDANDTTEVALGRAAMKLAEDQRDLNEKAAVRAGTEWSNSGRARMLAVQQDESLVSLLTKYRVAAGRDLKPEERTKIQKQADEIKRAKRQIESPGMKDKPEVVQAAARKKFDDALAELKKMPKAEMMTKECFL